MRRAMQSVGMKMFVDFYEAFKSGQKDETIRLLQQNGDALSGARTRWSVAQRIFENGWQRGILELIKSNQLRSPTELLDRHISANPIPPKNDDIPDYVRDPSLAEMTIEDLQNMDDRTPEQVKESENSEEEIYSIKNFSI